MPQETEPISLWDKPADCYSNWTEEERLYKDYRNACNTTSVSGEILKLLGGVTIVIGTPLSLLLGLGGIAVAVTCIGAGASMAAIGSTASSSKKAAKLAEFTAWRAIR